jgi:hypothetical protein
MAIQWRKNFSSGKRKSNAEADELYQVSKKVIELARCSADKDRLRDIESRCLNAAHYDGAINSHLSAP